MIIYKILNKVNGKMYIGQTKHTLNYRKSQHLHESKKNNNQHIYKAIRKYGKDNFVWNVICECKNREELNEKENFFIWFLDTFENGYNKTTGGDCEYKHNEETIKILKYKRKLQPPPVSKGTIRKQKDIKIKKDQSGEKNSFFGKKHTEESKRKMSESHKGRGE